MECAATPNAPRESTRLISTEEVTRRISRSRSTIYRWMELGIFPRQATKPDSTSSALWHEDEVDAFIEGRRNPSSVGPKPSFSGSRDQHKSNAPKMTSSQETTPGPRHKCQPYILPMHSSQNGPEYRPLLRQLKIGSQLAYFEPETGRIFVVIGQLPPNQASEPLVAFARAAGERAEP